MEAAVAAGERAKVITTDSREYKFKRLENKNNSLTGITRQGSSTAKKLTGMPVGIDGKNLEIDLSGLDIEVIKLRIKTESELISLVVIAASLTVVYYASVLLWFSLAGW